MNTIELLGQQHEQVLARLAAIEPAASANATNGELAEFLAFLEGEVAEHFRLEEEALFPVLERRLGVSHGPLAVMNAEHTTFRALMHGLGASVRAGDLDRQRDCTLQIVDLLRGHIAKEDNVLFPMAARMLTREEQHEVEARAAGIAGTHTAPRA